MRETTLKIALAGLVHDIGKFAERAYVFEQGDKDSVQQDYRYGHAYITEVALRDIFPEALEQKIDTSEDLADCTVLNLAARHHNPRNAYELMIAEADRIASGHGRAGTDDKADFETTGRERKSQIPLLSILGGVGSDEKDNSDPTNMRYRIAPPPLQHGPEFEGGFPVSPDEYQAKEVRTDYREHWQTFKEAVSRIDPLLQFDTFFELCRMYQWCLPASTRKDDLPDVSLFEHQKATAALASCMYCYHAASEASAETVIRDRNEKKYLLFCGDISGIQGFIYQISSKGAYKTLKGRSFFIQLLAEVLARKFIAAFGLTAANILYASGGKFYLLLPRSDGVAEKLAAMSDEINLELRKKYAGDLFIRTGQVALSGNDLTGASGRNLSMIWDELGHRLVFEDRCRYSSLARDHYELIFGTGGSGEFSSCEVCHRSMRTKSAEEKKQCSSCRKMEEIGRRLGKSHFLIMAGDNAALDGRYDFRVFENYFWFREDVKEIKAHKDCFVWALNDPDFAAAAVGSSLAKVNAAPLIVGSTHRFEKEFDDIAKKSKGVNRLGILRMDVDNLGRIFSHGLKKYRKEDKGNTGRYHSLGRITTLSWQLSLFFGAMVPAMIRDNGGWRDRVTVVYSGGDDLFILGAWDAIPGVALAVRKAFDRFCCGNSAWGLSGGMVMTGGKFPIYKSAEMAGEAESAAKKYCVELPGGERKKNAFSFFDTVMAWEEFEEVSRVHEKLAAALEKKENRPLLSRLRAIGASWAGARELLLRSPGMSMDLIRQNLEAEKWRWRMVYSLKRLADSRGSLEGTIKDVQAFIINPVNERGRWGIELLGVLSRWCELESRGPANNRGGE